MPLTAGQPTIVKLVPPGPRFVKKIHAALDKGLTVKAKVQLEVDDGNAEPTVVRQKVELT